MKQLIVFFLVMFIGFELQVFTQESDTTLIKQDETDTVYKETKNSVSIGKSEMVKIVEHQDTTKIKVGNKEVSIIEEEDGTSIKVKETKVTEDSETKIKKGGKHFKGHWAGVDLGLNNYVDNNFSLARNSENEFLDLNTGKSWNVNVNFAQFSIGFGTDRVGLVTGMGLEFNNYFFSGDSSIAKVDGKISTKGYEQDLIKNKLRVTYLTVPLLLETQFAGPKRSDRVHIAAGVIAGLKIGSRAKVKYVEDGDKQRDKTKSDFYLSPFRYGVTARVGYKMVNLYCNYYLTPLFVDGRGPELYPVSAGIVFSL
ncbi:MAG: PorT family protein [Bacteroidales bacterium]|nr:PorT family protein [Bacteroidales bacterium]